MLPINDTRLRRPAHLGAASTQTAKRATRSDEIDETALLAAPGCVSVTAEQLTRWRRAGLLPRPRLRPRAAGEGHDVCYPAWARHQLAAIAQVDRTIQHWEPLVLAVWWAGHWANPAAIRHALSSTLGHHFAGAPQTRAGAADPDHRSGARAARSRRQARSRQSRASDASPSDAHTLAGLLWPPAASVHDAASRGQLYRHTDRHPDGEPGLRTRIVGRNGPSANAGSDASTTSRPGHCWGRRRPTPCWSVRPRHTRAAVASRQR